MGLRLSLVTMLLWGASVTASAQPHYLPLEVGNHWKLRSSASGDTMGFHVLAVTPHGYRVRWDNQWKKADFYLQTDGHRVLLNALDMGDGVVPMPPETVYFDFGRKRGNTWRNALGTLHIVDRRLEVTTPHGVYVDCIEFKINYGDGTAQYLTFAPGIGFVRFGRGINAFKLVRTRAYADAHTYGHGYGVKSKRYQQVNEYEVPKSRPRTIAIDVRTALGENYETAFSRARALGMKRIGLHLTWERLEPKPSQYDSHWLDIAARYYPNDSVAVDLSLVPIDTNRNTMPVDLRDLPMDHPRVIDRFKSLVDFALQKFSPGTLSSLNIGSEYDIYLGQNEKRWQAFTNFYAQIAHHVNTHFPDIIVASEGTFKGITDKHRQRMVLINRYSDAIGVSYYPMHIDNTAKFPVTVHKDFERLVKLYPNKPILFYQLGYPSSPRVSSSEKKQAEFVRHVFSAWDKHSNHIELIDFTWLNDQSPSEIRKTKKYYGASGSRFEGFVGSLGLADYRGRPKPAYYALQEEVATRRW